MIGAELEHTLKALGEFISANHRRTTTTFITFEFQAKEWETMKLLNFSPTAWTQKMKTATFSTHVSFDSKVLPSPLPVIQHHLEADQFLHNIFCPQFFFRVNNNAEHSVEPYCSKLAPSQCTTKTSRSIESSEIKSSQFLCLVYF